MNKLTLVLLLLCFAAISVYSQQSGTTIVYGNNKEAGKYYDIRGFKMYCETYGQGQPLLIIHGNGGSISNFINQIPYFTSKYKVIVADSRARGKLKDPGDSLSYEMMADDYAALPDAMKESCRKHHSMPDPGN